MSKPSMQTSAVFTGGLVFCMTVASLVAFGKTDDDQSQSKKFERELASPFGAKVATKNGATTIRQTKDSAGRVRKRIIAGTSFSEIQLDQNGDGTVDFWEINSGDKTVVATHPSHGRFLSLNVIERSKEGAFEAHYLLDKDGRRYNLYRTKFTRADRMLNSQSTLSVDHEAWREQQVNTWAPDLICHAGDSPTGRLASLQRDWWQIIKHDYELNLERIKEDAKASALFDRSCKSPNEQFDSIAHSLSELIATSPVSKPESNEVTRGSYLRCLEQSGLGIVAAKIEKNLISGLNDYQRPNRLFKCDFQNCSLGRMLPGSATSAQVTIRMCLEDNGKLKTQNGSTQTYKNVLFHELIHVAEIESEELTYAAQACCGDPSDDKVSACARLDKLVADERRFAELEAFLSRDKDISTLIAQLKTRIGVNGFLDLYREFLLGFDKTEAFDTEKFKTCVRFAGRSMCSETWKEKILKYTNHYFEVGCKDPESGASRAQCDKVTEKDRTAIASALAAFVIPAETIGGNDQPLLCKNEVEKKSFAANPIKHFLKLFASANAEENAPCEEGLRVPPLQSVVKQPPSPIPGEVRPIAVVLPMNPVTTTRPTFSVPGNLDLGGVVSRPGGDTSVVASPEAPTMPTRIPDRSPLPVTNVTSISSGRTIAERSYQRATDVAGLATRGFKDLRDSIVPRAKAADRSSGRPKRLDGDESFVAFRPENSKLKAITIDNPFAANRALPAFDSSTSAAQGVKQSAISSMDTGSAIARAAEPTKPSQVGTAKAEPVERAKGSTNPSSTAAKNPADRKLDNVASLGTSTAPPRDPAGLPSRPLTQSSASIDGLFTQRYQHIAERLNDLKVQQLLVDRGIKVINADGRALGAKKHVKLCYKYVGHERPLKTPCGSHSQIEK